MGGRGKRSESDQSTAAIKAYWRRQRRLLLIEACTAPTRGVLSRRKSAAGWARKHAEQAHIIAVLRDKRTRTLPSGMLYGRWAWKPHEDTVLSGRSQNVVLRSKKHVYLHAAEARMMIDMLSARLTEL